MLRYWLCLGMLILLPLSAGAGSIEEARKHIESDMTLTGKITVGPQGEVREYSIDKPEKVDQSILVFLQKSVQAWKFEPLLVGGKSVAIRNKMSMQLVAEARPDGNYDVRINGVYFSPDLSEAEEAKAKAERNANRMMPPRYPRGAVIAGVEGTVYLLLKLRPDGSVEDVIAEKVNLLFLGNGRVMDAARKLLAQSSIQAAKAWKVKAPGNDPELATMRVPVDYCISDSCGAEAYGRWRSYVPGPVQAAPWSQSKDASGFTLEALPGNGDIYPLGGQGGLRLLTPLQNVGS